MCLFSGIYKSFNYMIVIQCFLFPHKNARNRFPYNFYTRLPGALYLLPSFFSHSSAEQNHVQFCSPMHWCIFHAVLKTELFFRTEAALQRCSWKKLFWKYSANLRRTSMSKCDFNKIAKYVYWNPALSWVFSFKFSAYFKNTFS